MLQKENRTTFKQSFILGFWFLCNCKEVFIGSLVLILMNYLIRGLKIYYSYLLLWESENLTYCTIKVHLSFTCCKILAAEEGSAGIICTNCPFASLNIFQTYKTHFQLLKCELVLHSDMQYLRMPVPICVMWLWNVVWLCCDITETPVPVCHSAVMGTALGFDMLRRHDSSDSMDVNLF